MKLNKIQQKCINALEGHPKYQEAFLALCEVNGRKWRGALCRQFMTDANVCNIDDKLLPYIRGIRNSLLIDDILER